MADDHAAVHAEKRRAAILCHIQPFFQFSQGRLDQQRSQLREKPRVHQFVLDELDDRLCQSLAEFQKRVAHKTVADDHVESSLRDVPPLRVARKMNDLFFPERRQKRICLAGELVALRLLLADIEKADPRRFMPIDEFRIDRAHQGAL